MRQMLNKIKLIFIKYYNIISHKFKGEELSEIEIKIREQMKTLHHDDEMMELRNYMKDAVNAQKTRELNAQQN